MKKKPIKLPSAMRLLCGGAVAYWLSHIINPAFVAIAVMIVLFIFVFMPDYFPVQTNAEKIDKQHRRINKPINLKTAVSPRKARKTRNKSRSCIG